MASRKKQLEFEGFGFEKPGQCFGGSKLKSNPKTRRPLDSKLPVHLVLRAFRGGMSHPHVFGAVAKIIKSSSKKWGIKIYKQSNNGNHLHFGIRITQRANWQGFIRELTGRIALVMKKKFAIEGKFWLGRPFTRIVAGWGKAFKTLLEYIYLNQLEAEGFIKRKETKSLKDLRAIFSG